VTDVQVAALAADAPRILAEEYGLTPAGARPSFPRYIADLWARRHFIVSYTKASNAATYSRSLLGQLWQVLTPLLNAFVYYIIFGILLRTSRGVHNYICFLIIGVFVFHFMTHAMNMASKAVQSNLNLIRTLKFPRASLPLGTTTQCVQQFLISCVVLVPVALFTGERPTAKWLFALPTILLCCIFALGLSMVVARIGARIPDTTQILPFILRTWLFFSGVFYNVDKVANRHGALVRYFMHLNPGAVYIDLMRSSILRLHPYYRWDWIAGVGWAVVALVFGLVYFWHAEEDYGRG
jgi:teichoic acid transport system permease protein